MTPLFKTLSHIVDSIPATARLHSAISEDNAFVLSNLPASLDTLVFAHLFLTAKKYILLVFDEAKGAERAFDDLAKLLGEDALVLFSQVAQQSTVKQELRKKTAMAENDAQILEALEKLTQSKENLIVISDAESLLIGLPDPQIFSKETLHLSVGENIGYDFFSLWLREHRFEGKQFVETSGDYAIRGGIIDIFPFTETIPFRIEFFGDAIESIREFDAISQRSIAQRQELSLVPNALESEYISRFLLAAPCSRRLPKSSCSVKTTVFVVSGSKNP